jgi:recombinational DNA repair ATPase RecF
MKLRTLEIKNFRAVKEIELRTDKAVNVIVGPNASGKTTILEAVRLAKGILSPRYAAEGQQVLQSLGTLRA